MPIALPPVDLAPMIAAQHAVRSYGLLAGDALIIALMQRHGLSHLATNDDFDSVPGITVWKPR